MTLHTLKVWPEHFVPLLLGYKNFEVRRADRRFVEGDTLQLAEWDPRSGKFTGNGVVRQISYVVDLTPIGCPGFVGIQLDGLGPSTVRAPP